MPTSVGGGQIAPADVLEPVAQVGLAYVSDRGIVADLLEAERDHAAQRLARGLVGVRHEPLLEAAEEHALLAQRFRDVQEVVLEHELGDRTRARLLAAAEVLTLLVDDDAGRMRGCASAQAAGVLRAIGGDSPPADGHSRDDRVDAFGLRTAALLHAILLGRNSILLPDFSQNVKGCRANYRQPQLVRIYQLLMLKNRSAGLSNRMSLVP